MPNWRASLLPSLLALGAACGGEEPPPPPRTAESIAVVAGNDQQGQAGVPLPEPVAFLVSDRNGPLAGVRVDLAPSASTALVSPATITTGPSGRVSVTWIVGGTLGDQTLTATVAGIAPAVARASVIAGPPALVSPLTAANQFVVVGRLVAQAPAARVADGFGNPIAGLELSFVDPTARSEVIGSPAVTNGAGVAGIASWRIGTAPGAYTLVASTPSGASTGFLAFGTPASLEPVAGNHQAANAGTILPLTPSVLALDDEAHGLGGVAVRFQVAEGGGRLLGAGTVPTGPDGIALAPGWVLGLTPGANRLEAIADGVPVVAFQATGLAAVAASAEAVSPLDVSGTAGNFVTPSPAVRLTDAGGAPVAGVPVSFAVAAGTASLARAQRVTDFSGTARLGGLRLGADPGGATVTASSNGLAPVVFAVTARPRPAGEFTIDVRFVGPPPTEQQQAVFAAAAARWQAAILGDLDDVSVGPDLDLSFCGGQTLSETVDDVLIFATIEAIDGVGGILGQAGPCYVRNGSLLTVIGRMIFDQADVANLQVSGRFHDVVLHEMGHVLGIGSLWRLRELLDGPGTADPVFTGATSHAAWAAADPEETFTGRLVPVENSGGAGTRDVHWRELVARNELMTGFLNSGENPLSAVTIASLRDLGYEVDDASADPFTLAAALASLRAGPSIPLNERPLATAIRVVDRAGTVRRVFLPEPGPYRR